MIHTCCGITGLGLCTQVKNTWYENEYMPTSGYIPDLSLVSEVPPFTHILPQRCPTRMNSAQPPGTKKRPPSRPRRPRWWRPGIHSFSGTWTRSCEAGLGICVSEVGRPQAEAQRSGASAPGRGPRSRLGPHPAPLPLLRLHLLCCPSSEPAECVHWGTKRK